MTLSDLKIWMSMVESAEKTIYLPSSRAILSMHEVWVELYAAIEYASEHTEDEKTAKYLMEVRERVDIKP